MQRTITLIVALILLAAAVFYCVREWRKHNPSPPSYEGYNPGGYTPGGPGGPPAPPPQ